MRSYASCSCRRKEGELVVQPNLCLTPRRIQELSQRGMDVPDTGYVRPPEVSDLPAEDYTVRAEMRAEMDTNDVWNLQHTARRRVNAMKRVAVVESKESE